MLKKLRSLMMISIIALISIPLTAKAYYQDTTNQVYRLNTSETLTLTYIGTGVTNDLHFYSSDLNYNLTVKDASSVQTLGLASQTSNYQPVTLNPNYTVTIKNNSTTQMLYVDASLIGMTNFNPTTTSQGSFTYNGEGGGPVPQGTQTGTATIQSGNLRISLASNTFSFPPTTLDGSIKTISTSLPTVDVVDATGTAQGWNLQVSASPFTEIAPTGGFASGTSAKVFTNEAYTIQPTSVIGVNGSSLTGVSINNTRQSILNTNAIVASATSGNGTGEYQVAFGSSALQLQILNNKAYVDLTNYPSNGTPYQSTLTWVLSVAP